MFQTIPLNSGGVQRRYLIARLEAAAPRPLVVMLHGTGGNAKFAVEETGLAEFGQSRGFISLFPDGLAVDPSLPPKFLTNPQRWNDGATKPGDLLHTSADDVQFLADAIDDAIRHRGADARRVFVTGFSNGAGMCFRFAAERADLIAAVAPVAGYCWVKKPKPSKPMPTLYIIGEADPLVPWHGGEVRSPWGDRIVQRPRVPDNLRAWKQANAGAEFEEVIVPGLGHHWPGGAGRLNPRIGGPSGGVVNANELVWEFFSSAALAPLSLGGRGELGIHFAGAGISFKVTFFLSRSTTTSISWPAFWVPITVM